MNYTSDEAKTMRETNFFDPRNVADRFKGMPTETVKSILQSESSELVICCSNVIRDFNFGSVIRSANSFNAKEVVLTGRKSYDRRGTVGAHNYMTVSYIEDINEAFAAYRSQGYTIVAAEYDETRIQFNLQDYNWNEKTFLVFGEEGRGLESDILDSVDDIVYIPMYGSVRSMNVASASSVFMYDYMTKIRKTNGF